MTDGTPVLVRAAGPADRSAIVDLLTNSWGGTSVVAHGVVFDAATLPALIAERAGALCGLLTYDESELGFEVVTLDAVERRSGAGTALIEAAAALARRNGRARLWLATTNDNLDALRFYQRRGLRIVEVRPGAVDAARRLKPSIPETGDHGIPLHDELILELVLNPARRGEA